MIVIVPALITDDESEELLVRTLSRFPPEAAITLALVTQGKSLELPPIPGIRSLAQTSFPRPIGKWAAVRAGFELVADQKRDPVMLLDADDPVSTRSLMNAIRFAESDHFEYVIGERTSISLSADDQRSPFTRLFVEAFSNTLLLVVLGGPCPLLQRGPDVQSGFYLLSSRAREALTLDYVADYGGELAMFFELVSRGYSFGTLDIESNKPARSSYLVSAILRSIAGLPFFRDASQKQLTHALTLAPRLYARYFESEMDRQFAEEMQPLVDRAFRFQNH